ncbi:MAG: aminotransferase class III-fold pyridoxal phosphate-dependent enzyme, partial [Bifidobacteriales bacterium]|nr:aminotransferase class III-fold pyridoxal phosphate-dependent enzyme [Bifidobacteriales bacterium]
LEACVTDHPSIFEEVRGIGLMRGLRCRIPVGEVLEAVMAEGLLAIGAGDNVLRLVPPLIATEADCAEACTRIGRAAHALSNQ